MTANFLIKSLLLGYSIERTDKPVAYSFIDNGTTFITFTTNDPNDYHTTIEIKEDLTDGNWVIGSFNN